MSNWLNMALVAETESNNPISKADSETVSCGFNGESRVRDHMTCM